jgi:DNA-directed RNA polymerase specialized sigma subunit
MNPVEDFLQVKEATLEQKREQELQQLQLWRKTQKPEHLAPLIKSFEPVINKTMQQHRAPSIPEAAFRAEAKDHLIRAFETYDPNRGASLSTHVHNHLKKVQRYNITYQNTAYIPEEPTRLIGKIQQAQEALRDDLGRDPTHAEIGRHIGRPTQMVSRIITAAGRKDVPSSSFENDPTEHALRRDQEVLDLLPFNLTPAEKQVFNHIYGREGHALITDTGTLAKKIGKSDSQISRLRTSILDKYKMYK